MDAGSLCFGHHMPYLVSYPARGARSLVEMRICIVVVQLARQPVWQPKGLMGAHWPAEHAAPRVRPSPALRSEKCKRIRPSASAFVVFEHREADTSRYKLCFAWDVPMSSRGKRRSMRSSLHQSILSRLRWGYASRNKLINHEVTRETWPLVVSRS